MKQILLLLILCTLLTVPVRASEAISEQAVDFGTEDLERHLPKSAERWMKDLSPTDSFSFSEKVRSLLEAALQQSDSLLDEAVKRIIQVISILVLCSFAECIEREYVSKTAIIAGVLAITLACTNDVRSMIGMGTAAIEEITAFSSFLFPVMASAAAASGALSGAANLYAVAVFFSGLFIRLMKRILLPLMYAFLAASVLDTILQDQRLQNLRGFCAWGLKVGLKTIMYVFTGFLSLTGIFSGSADALHLKAARMTISGMIPVVGSIVSDAAETVLAGADYLRTTIGAFGMFAVLSVFFFPFLSAAIQYLTFQVIAVFGGLLGSKLMKLLKSISEAMGFLLAMIGCSLIMCFISCFSIMQIGK